MKELIRRMIIFTRTAFQIWIVWLMLIDGFSSDRFCYAVVFSILIYYISQAVMWVISGYFDTKKTQEGI